MTARSVLSTAGLLLLAGLGVAAVLLGGADDSPGLQGLGLLLVLLAGARAVRARRSRSGRGVDDG